MAALTATADVRELALGARAAGATLARLPGEARAALLRDLADFTAGTPARDDVTVVVLRVNAGNN